MRAQSRPNHAFQPTYLPPLRVVKSAAEPGRYVLNNGGDEL